MRRIIVGLLASVCLFPFVVSAAMADEPENQIAISDEPIVNLFGRDDCGFCKAMLAWVQSEELPYTYYNIVEDDSARYLYDAITDKHNISKITPVSVIGEQVIVGFNSPETTGVRIKAALEAAKNTDIRTPEEHLKRAPTQETSFEGGCSDVGCTQGEIDEFVFALPVVGIVDLKSLSLFTLSALLGLIDGFNPCAMWVLITFLVLLSQAGSRQKMIFLAGIFIVAEAVMYNLILNVWYKTWDFVALDQIVTPLVGLLALGGGVFFLWRWRKNRNAPLVCDISDIETQSKTISRFQAIISQPLTIGTVGAILVIAFSVNIIEFACSIGIPQAYTKILDLNLLTFLERQWYIFVYTLGYMFDDVIVFGLAIWGYSRLEAHGAKYSQLSLLIGGVLMLILGAILVFTPQSLVL